jgi:Na+:H+ antiporter, NhaA family
VLLVATVMALAWANSPARASYDALWNTEVALRAGSHVVADDLRAWVNDGLMVLFFFVVGLELKREIVQGDLGKPKRVALPALAALGGMIVPAAIFLALTFRSDLARGWGIPMATDVAFAVGILSLLGSRVPAALKLFLLSIAIVDDVGTIAVLALFYSSGVEAGPFALAITLLVAVLALRRMGVWWVPAYVALGVGVWWATALSGVHPTIAGVALGLLAPAQPQDEEALERSRDSIEGTKPSALRVSAMRRHALATVPVAERLEHLLHPWSSYVVVPVFAFANAGISFAGFGGARSSSLAVTVLWARVLGKLLGITLFTWVAVRARFATLPPGVGWRHVLGAAAVAGIGFTVPLFVSALAFDRAPLQEGVKVGILAASGVAAVIGSLVLVGPSRADPNA